MATSIPLSRPQVPPSPNKLKPIFTNPFENPSLNKLKETTSLPNPLPTKRSSSTSLPHSTPPLPTRPTLKKGLSSLTCRACTAVSMGSRYYPSKRAFSPGAQKLVIPGRSSTGTFPSSYDSYSAHPHSARDDYKHSSVSSVSAPRKSTGAIPISTEIVYKDPYPPSSSSGGTRDAYSGRPRRSSDLTTTVSPIRSRPAIIQEAAPRPSSPLARSYDPRETHTKPNTSARRLEPKTKLYSVDNSSAKLIAETEQYRERPRERGGYHLTGRSQRPREVDESSWSYTDPAGMYNDTEPIRRQRRGSVDGRRPTSVIEPSGYSNTYQRGSKDHGPPPTTRQFDRLNQVARTSNVREPIRGSSRDPQGSYDTYAREAYDMPLRTTSTMPVVVNQPEHRHSRDETYYRDDYDDYREPRRPSRQFTDDNVPSRGFGILMPGADRRGGSNSGVEEPISRSIYPPPSSQYAGETLVQMPSGSDFLPPAPIDDRREKPRDREREREREYERDRPKERDRPRDERPRDREEKPRDRDERPRDRDERPRDRDERPRERDDRAREREYDRDDRERHHRRLSKEASDNLREVAVPAAATAAGVAGVAVAGTALEKRHKERKYDSDEDRARGPRHEPNDREDNRERRYAEKDRDDKKRDEKPRDEKSREAALDSDEEYRRRIQAAQAELAGLELQKSKEEERLGSDPERQRRRDREDRDRERRQPRDGDSRRGSDEYAAPSQLIRSRPRGSSIDSEPETQHNRLPVDRRVTDRDYVQEPDLIPGAYPQTRPRGNSVAMAPPPPAPSFVPPQAGSLPPPPDFAPRSKSADPNASLSEKERRVTIVEPSKNEQAPEPAIKGILRKPTEKFPEHPNPIREGVTPLKERLKKEGGGKEIPDGAKWTKIDRRLVNPQALEEKQERFEERQDYVIVLRVLTKDEIQEFATRTNEIREEREERYNREKRRQHRHSHHDKDKEESDSDDREYRHSSSRKHRDDGDREREHRHSRDDGDREPHSERDRESRRKDYVDDDDDKAALRAIEDGRRGDRDRGRRVDLRDEYMSGGLGR